MSMLVYAGKPWGGVTVTDRDVASAAACRRGRRHFVSLEIQKNKSIILVDKAYSDSTYRGHHTNWVSAKTRWRIAEEMKESWR